MSWCNACNAKSMLGPLTCPYVIICHLFSRPPSFMTNPNFLSRGSLREGVHMPPLEKSVPGQVKPGL